MAVQVQQFAATIPAGTLESKPAVVPIDMDNWTLEQIDLEVPAGPAGLMGFYVANNGVQWIPRQVGTWLVWDDVQQSWALTDQPNASGWAVIGYNTGTFDHTITVRMHVTPPSDATAAVQPAPQVTIVTSGAPEQPAVTL